MKKYKEKDFVKIVGRWHGHHFEIGETVMISLIYGKDNGIRCCDVYSCGWQDRIGYSVFNRFGHCWNIHDCEMEPSTRRAFITGVTDRSKCNEKFNSFTRKHGPEVLKNWSHVAEEIDITKHQYQLSWNRPSRPAQEIEQKTTDAESPSPTIKKHLKFLAKQFRQLLP